MNIVTTFLVALLSVFSVVVMSYVAMATPLGPWIEPTIVLCAALLLKILPAWYGQDDQGRRLRLAVLIVAGSSIGGIMATAMGFAFPALYFLDPDLFNAWLQQPFYFWAITSSLALVGSLFGLWIAHVLEDQMLVQQRLMFPIGMLSYRMILAQNQLRKAKELAIGFVGTMGFCLGQILGWIPRCIPLLSSTTIGLWHFPGVRFDFFPMYWAIGFVSGHMIAIPLLVGALAKIFLVDPVNTFFFQDLSPFEFMLAFGSGLIVMGTVSNIWDAPQKFLETAKRILVKYFFKVDHEPSASSFLHHLTNYRGILILIPILIFFTYFKMPIWVLVYLLLLTFVCAYQVVYIAGKIGLAQLGRFATFVMLPAVFLFSLDMINITFIAVFVELASGVAADALFGLKMAQLAGVPSKTIKRYQLFGILVSSAVVGIVFWALIHKFGLGSEELFAQRAQTRALLVNVTKFNPLAIALGMIFAYLLNIFKINPMLVLSGLLMPINVSLSLITGGVYALWTKHKEEQYPFWSGVFASHSIWMVVNALLG